MLIRLSFAQPQNITIKNLNIQPQYAGVTFGVKTDKQNTVSVRAYYNAEALKGNVAFHKDIPGYLQIADPCLQVDKASRIAMMEALNEYALEQKQCPIYDLCMKKEPVLEQEELDVER